MDFRHSQELDEFRRSVESFSRERLASGALTRAHAADYPWDVAKEMAAMGLLGLTISEEKGGQGGSLLAAVIAIQAIASGCPRSADVVQAGNFGPIPALGTSARNLSGADEIMIVDAGLVVRSAADPAEVG